MLSRARRSATWCLLQDSWLAALGCVTGGSACLDGRVGVKYATKGLSLRERLYRTNKASQHTTTHRNNEETPQIIRLNVILAVLQHPKQKQV